MPRRYKPNRLGQTASPGFPRVPRSAPAPCRLLRSVMNRLDDHYYCLLLWADFIRSRQVYPWGAAVSTAAVYCNFVTAPPRASPESVGSLPATVEPSLVPHARVTSRLARTRRVARACVARTAHRNGCRWAQLLLLQGGRREVAT